MRTLKSLLDERREGILKPDVIVKCETKEEVGKLRYELLLELDYGSSSNVPNSPNKLGQSKLPIYVAVSPIRDQVDLLDDNERTDLCVLAKDIAFREDIYSITELIEGEEYKIILDDIDKESVEYSLLTKGIFKRVTYNLEELVSAENTTEELIECFTLKDILNMRFVKVTNLKMVAFTAMDILADTYLVKPIGDLDLYTFNRLTKLDQDSGQYEFTEEEICNFSHDIQQMIADELLTVIDSVKRCR